VYIERREIGRNEGDRIHAEDIERMRCNDVYV
jgi:hypothetical protein